MRLTPLERDVWIAAFAANQPQPCSPGGQKDGAAAKYWAAQAVFVIRGEKVNATAQEQEAMFNYVIGSWT